MLKKWKNVTNYHFSNSWYIFIRPKNYHMMKNAASKSNLLCIFGDTIIAGVLVPWDCRSLFSAELSCIVVRVISTTCSQCISHTGRVLILKLTMLELSFMKAAVAALYLYAFVIWIQYTFSFHNSVSRHSFPALLQKVLDGWNVLYPKGLLQCSFPSHN